MSISQRIHGFIPRLHLAEVLLKNPEKKFASGKKLKCKVSNCSDGNVVTLHCVKLLLQRLGKPSVTEIHIVAFVMLYK